MVNSENPINTDTDEPIEHDTLNHPTQAEKLIALDKLVSSKQEERNEYEIDPSLSGDDREVYIGVLDVEISDIKMVLEGLRISILEQHSRGILSREDSEFVENLLAQEREEAQQIVETSERERTQIVEITDERLQLDDTARELFRPGAKIELINCGTVKTGGEIVPCFISVAMDEIPSSRTLEGLAENTRINQRLEQASMITADISKSSQNQKSALTAVAHNNEKLQKKLQSKVGNFVMYILKNLPSDNIKTSNIRGLVLRTEIIIDGKKCPVFILSSIVLHDDHDKLNYFGN